MTECAKCGDCCERINMKPYTGYELRRRVLWDVSAQPDGLFASEAYPKEAENLEDAHFILKHWSVFDIEEDGTEHYVCDQFDRETRLCKAHDSRPPVCQGYPWYGKQPSEERGRVLPKRCSFIRDLPKEQWPEGAEPLEG